ncbi:LPS-assembly protein LptD [Roseiterribacter gracilis]|uniref:LPS-assembly protein LptD n=1 Tax=Roseiterribacter gracilis TaxID=2812848 RepID=A0A8S8X9J2_9PROT|nr:LPS-assembly protein LptD [Rhodospirillales bacterium TMPK1]
MPALSHSLRTFLLGSVACLALGVGTAAAQQPKPATPASAPAAASSDDDSGKKTPILLDADELTQDEALGIITARGKVELIKGPNTLTADVMNWNRNSGIVTASGHVRMVQPTGEILFGDYAELTDDMAEGFIENARALMKDNGRMAGRHAERKGGSKTVVSRGVYSPCDLCATDPSRPPIWQIKARTTTHDEEDHRISYRDATMEMFGVPVLWTPWFSHPDPSVKRKSGFLNPQIGFKSQLGGVMRNFYYWDIEPDLDATIELSEFTQQGPLFGAQIRKRFENGLIRLGGSITESNITSSNGTAIEGEKKGIRGHIFGEGRFDLDDNWRAGFDLARSLDDVYVRRYGYSTLDVLRNRVFAEGFFGRSYVNASAYAFQDLRPGLRETQPVAAPYVVYSALGAPGETLGGRWSLDASVLSLMRTSNGQDVRRVAGQAGWERKWISDFGLVTTANLTTTVDGYWADSVQATDAQSTPRNGFTGRVFPQGSVTSSMPFVRQFDFAQITLEPIVGVTVSPNFANNRKIPNEDSRDVELEASNLFAPSRYPGVDRVEDGSRVTYGGRMAVHTQSNGYGSIFLGQSYRISGSTLFPDGSGLENRRSDYVGQVQLVPGKWVDVDWRFRVSTEGFKQNLHEVNFSLGPPEFFFNGTYLFAASAPNAGVPTDRNELTMGVYGRINQFWTANATGTYRMAPDRKPVRYGTSIAYADECFNVSLDMSRDLTNRVGGLSGTSFFVRIGFKNLGQFASPKVTQ